MFYQVISYNSVRDVLTHYRLTESKNEALRFLRDAESSGCDCIRLFIDKTILKNQKNEKI